jgi:hypothetical protein
MKPFSTLKKDRVEEYFKQVTLRGVSTTLVTLSSVEEFAPWLPLL